MLASIVVAQVDGRTGPSWVDLPWRQLTISVSIAEQCIQRYRVNLEKGIWKRGPCCENYHELGKPWVV